MTKKEEYYEKLKDPRWQKKRLQILERDEFTCQFCGDKETTLHIHHKYYEEVEPWEHDDSALITLCKDCHEKESKNKKEALSSVYSRLSFLDSEEIYEIEYLIAVASETGEVSKTIDLLGFILNSPIWAKLSQWRSRCEKNSSYAKFNYGGKNG